MSHKVITPELLRILKRLELTSRKAVETTFSGEYHSVFKGRGLRFSEVREYQVGDDVRFIDWNVTAKMGSPFIKVFDEDRELTVILAVDVSGSGHFGSADQSKLDLAAEVAGLLGFSAIYNQDRVGLLLFSDRVEKYVPPKKGRAHMMRLLRDLYCSRSMRGGTDIDASMKELMKLHSRRAIVLVISDFMDPMMDRGLKLVARKHDLVPVIVEDPREKRLPNVGLITLEDVETGQSRVVNTSSADVRKRFEAMMVARDLDIDRYFQQMGVLPVRVSVGAAIGKPLMAYFKARAQRQ